MASPLLQPTVNPAEKLGQKVFSPPQLATKPIQEKVEAKGLERIIFLTRNFVISAQTSTKKLLYGKYKLQSDEKVKKIEKAFDRGLLYVVSKIAGIDFCKIISTSLNGIKLDKLTFDPFNPPNPATSTNFEQLKWRTQYRAFQVQKYIDDFYAIYGLDTGAAARTGLKELMTQLNLTLVELTNQQGGLANPQLLNQFPETSLALNFINNAITKFSSAINAQGLSSNDVQNILKTINDTRQVAVVIQSLNNPAAALNLADRLFIGGELNDAMQQAEEFFSTRSEPLRFIKYLLQKAKSLNSTGKSILGYINLARTLMKLLLLLTKAFYIIVLWFKGVPLSAAFTTVGALNAQNDVLTNAIERKGIAAFIARLQQFDTLLREIARLAEIIIIGCTEIISKLNLVKLNMESCNPEMAREIDDTIEESRSVAAGLTNFLNQINNNIERTDTSFGAYTISIITEELVDENITLKRRYGIARDSNNYIVAESTPTFASWDQIIINEVKFILASKGLVKTSASFLSPDQAVVYENAVSLLGDDVLEFDAQELNAIDFGNENAGDIAEFFSNLPGGSKFRKSSRDKIIANNQKLLDTLKSSDPNSKYTKSIVVQTQNTTNKLKIQNLEEEKAKLKAEIAAAAVIPLAAAVIPKLVKRIKQIDEEIAVLKTG